MALLSVATLLFGFVLAEPTLGHSQAYNQFMINQTVTAEISFVTPTNNVTMDTAIPGITGGTANGATNVRVYTNNNTGYNMTIAASSTPALQGNYFAGNIPNYTVGTANTPDYVFSVAANSARFGYTISASTTSDLDQKFLDNGSACKTGSSDTAGSASCWYGLSTTATSTINRTTATTASGATSTIFFRTQIQSNPAPSVTEDTYTATTTLTATVNP